MFVKSRESTGTGTGIKEYFVIFLPIYILITCLYKYCDPHAHSSCIPHIFSFSSGSNIPYSSHKLLYRAITQTNACVSANAVYKFSANNSIHYNLSFLSINQSTNSSSRRC